MIVTFDKYDKPSEKSKKDYQIIVQFCGLLKDPHSSLNEYGRGLKKIIIERYMILTVEDLMELIMFYINANKEKHSEWVSYMTKYTQDNNILHSPILPRELEYNENDFLEYKDNRLKHDISYLENSMKDIKKEIEEKGGEELSGELNDAMYKIIVKMIEEGMYPDNPFMDKIRRALLVRDADASEEEIVKTVKSMINVHDPDFRSLISDIETGLMGRGNFDF